MHRRTVFNFLQLILATWCYLASWNLVIIGLGLIRHKAITRIHTGLLSSGLSEAKFRNFNQNIFFYCKYAFENAVCMILTFPNHNVLSFFWLNDKGILQRIWISFSLKTMETMVTTYKHINNICNKYWIFNKSSYAHSNSVPLISTFHPPLTT